MLTVFGRATSSNVQLVMWTVAELGLRFERLDYGHVHGGLDTPEYDAMNPHRHVPTLRDGDLVVWESCAILRYLAAQYGDGGAFWPSDPMARATVDMWAEWGKNELAQAFTVPIFWSRVRTAAALRDQAALDSGPNFSANCRICLSFAARGHLLLRRNSVCGGQNGILKPGMSKRQ